MLYKIDNENAIRFEMYVRVCKKLLVINKNYFIIKLLVWFFY